MSIAKRLFVSCAFLLFGAGAAFASSFRAADIIYVPAVARTAGLNGSFFKTDVTVSNLSNARVVVKVIYFPTNTADNTAAASTAVTLPTFAPFERRELTDIVQTVLNRTEASGYLVFLACREGSTCADCDTNPADCLNITVESRIYNATSNGTYGQGMPGIPWYNYASINSSDRGLDTVFISGVRNQTVVSGGTGYRTNIGILNASEFSTTVLRVKLFANSGTLVGTKDYTLGPLAHKQFPITDIAPSFEGDGYVTIEQASVTPVSGTTDANPGFFAYGSLLDNLTNDPTTLEAQFGVPLPIDCLYGSKSPKRMLRRR